MLARTNASVRKCVRWSHTDFIDRALPLTLASTIYFLWLFVGLGCTNCSLGSAPFATIIILWTSIAFACPVFFFFSFLLYCLNNIARRKIELSLCVVLAEFNFSYVSLSAVYIRSTSMLEQLEQSMRLPGPSFRLHTVGTQNSKIKLEQQRQVATACKSTNKSTANSINFPLFS